MGGGEDRGALVVEGAQEASAPASSARPAPLRRVLLIDDEPTLLKAYRRMLNPLLDVAVAGGGVEALELLRSPPGFDLVLCDLMMADLDGPAIYDAVCVSAPHMAPRFVFCTGGAFSPRAKAFVARVDNLFLEKPVSRDRILEVVEEIVLRTQGAAST